MFLKSLKCICLLSLLSLPLVHSTYLKNLDCDLENLDWYQDDPEGENAQVQKASCLLKEGREQEGLDILKRLANKPYDNVNAAYHVARYKLTGIDNIINDENLDETIEAYIDVFHLIKSFVNYPNFLQRDSEIDQQISLWSYYRIAHLFFLKFHRGFYGAHQNKLFNSTKYTGDKSQLVFYKQYQDYTKNSLLQAEEYAEVCANLSKRWYFKDLHYKEITRSCQLIKDSVTELLALEDHRRESLDRCRDLTTDNKSCPEYRNTKNQVVDLVKTVIDNHKKLVTSLSPK